MRGLFARVFVSVWVAMTLSGAAFVVIEGTRDAPVHERRRENLFYEAVRAEAAAAATADEDVVARLHAFEERTDATVFLFEADGEVVAPRAPSAAARQLAQTVREGGNRRREKDSAHLFGFLLADGETVAVARIRRMTTWTHALGLETLPQKLLVVLLLSGIVAGLLARYLVGPIERLRRATRRIAAGELDARVAAEVRRPDELAALARDFDAMAARVEELVAARDRLLADVAHELNSPLARLRVALELARKRAGSEAAPSLDRIEREAERLGELVAGILAVARFEQGAIERAPVDLGALVEAVARDADFEARAEDRAVVYVGPEGVARVPGDAEVLRRAVENVVRNAVRFTAPGTEVEVRLERAEGALRVRVRDHGPGVPEEARARIFEPLFRLEKDRARQTGGAGLGLAITARAVRAHGGEVEATAAAGGGLLVTLTLPAA